MQKLVAAFSTLTLLVELHEQQSSVEKTSNLIFSMLGSMLEILRYGGEPYMEM